MNKMLSGMQGLPPGFPPLPVLPPQSYYPPAPMHTAPYQGGPSFQQGFPSSGYGQQTPQSTLSFAGQQFVPYPYTSGYYGQSFSDVGGSLGAGAHPGALGAVSAAMPGASALRADSDDTKTGLTRPVSFLIHRV